MIDTARTTPRLVRDLYAWFAVSAELETAINPNLPARRSAQCEGGRGLGYLTFPDAGKGYALRSQLTWTHWRTVMRVCADKDETLVHYSILKESQQLFASKYRLVLPSEEELRAELERRHVFELPIEGGTGNGG